jgi:hypothetical protein
MLMAGLLIPVITQPQQVVTPAPVMSPMGLKFYYTVKAPGKKGPFLRASLNTDPVYLDWPNQDLKLTIELVPPVEMLDEAIPHLASGLKAANAEPIPFDPVQRKYLLEVPLSQALRNHTVDLWADGKAYSGYIWFTDEKTLNNGQFHGSPMATFVLYPPDR